MMEKLAPADTVSPSANPFPASPIARLASHGLQGINIITPASQQAMSFADAYVANIHDSTRSNSGRVLAIVGEYGTGKTHLAMTILARIQAEDISRVTAVYLDAPADSFLALYKDRFITKLQRSEIRQLVASYYIEIVATDLESSDLTSSMAKRLRTGDVSVDSVVHRLGLMESDFLQKLNIEIKKVAESEDFGEALSLFLRPEFESTVWDWLNGKEPDPALVERGITRTIDSDSAALEAMGVFAFLYGRSDRRLIIVIDELEKVLSPGSIASSDKAAILAFKKFLEVVGQTNGFLILSGLPDFLESLPQDARQRIGLLVRPTSLSKEDTAKYIQAAQEAVNGKVRLKPFSLDIVQYIVEIGGGNARRILRLCHHAYRAATEASTDITRAMVRDVARDQFEVATREDIEALVSRLLNANGWLFTRGRKWDTKDAVAYSDFWLPVGDSGLGCSIVITQSVLHPVDAKRLAEQGKLIGKAAPTGSLSLLIVNGYLAENLSETLNRAFDQVINPSHRDFSDNFEAIIKGMHVRIESEAHEDNLAIIRDRVDQLTRQNSAIRSLVASVASEAPSPELIRRSVEAGIRRVIGSGTSTSDVSTTGIPPLDDMFEDVLYRIRKVDTAAGKMISIRFSNLAHRDIKPTSRFNFRGADVYERELQFVRAAAEFSLLIRAVEAFRDSIQDVTQDLDREANIPHVIGERCQAFESLTSRVIASVNWDLILEGENGWSLLTGRLSPPMLSRRMDESLRDDLERLARRVYEFVIAFSE